MSSAISDEIIEINPCHIVGAGRAKRVHKIRPASVQELAAVTTEMPERLRLMVTLASWCAMRFGEIVELRRGDIDLSAEVIRIRRAAVRTSDGFTVTTPKSDAGLRDVAIPPHVLPLIELHLQKFVGPERDDLLFPPIMVDTFNRPRYTAIGIRHLGEHLGTPRSGGRESPDGLNGVTVSRLSQTAAGAMPRPA